MRWSFDQLAYCEFVGPVCVYSDGSVSFGWNLFLAITLGYLFYLVKTYRKHKREKGFKLSI